MCNDRPALHLSFQLKQPKCRANLIAFDTPDLVKSIATRRSGRRRWSRNLNRVDYRDVIEPG